MICGLGDQVLIMFYTLVCSDEYNVTSIDIFGVSIPCVEKVAILKIV